MKVITAAAMMIARLKVSIVVSGSTGGEGRLAASRIRIRNRRGRECVPVGG